MISKTSFGVGRAGARRTTPGSLAATQAAAAWNGLPDDIEDHWTLLRLLKRSRRALGLSQELYSHLEYLLERTRPIDWWHGSRPIVWESLETLADRFDCCQKTIRNRERDLAELGFLTWHDSGNYKRYGSRDASGRILYAYGVDLSPLGAMAPALQRAAAAEEAERLARKVEVQRRGHLRAEIRRLLIALERTEEAPGAVADEAPRVLAELRACNRELAEWRDALLHEALERIGMDADSGEEGGDEDGDGPVVVDQVLAGEAHSAPQDEAHDDAGGAGEIACKDLVSEVAACLGRDRAPSAPHFHTKVVTRYHHIQYKHQDSSSDRATCNASRGAGTVEAVEGPARRPPKTGIEHIRIEDVLAIATPRLMELLPAWDPPDWRDVIAAASVLRSEIGASQWIWLDGVALMGPAATAVAVIIAHARACDPGRRVRNPGGFLRGCLRKAEANDLHLHRTVFGLAARRAELAASAGRLQAASAVVSV